MQKNRDTQDRKPTFLPIPVSLRVVHKGHGCYKTNQISLYSAAYGSQCQGLINLLKLFSGNLFQYSLLIRSQIIKPFKSNAQISLPVVERHPCHVHVGVAFPLSSLRLICRRDDESCNLNPNPNPNIISLTSCLHLQIESVPCIARAVVVQLNFATLYQTKLPKSPPILEQLLG